MHYTRALTFCLFVLVGCSASQRAISAYEKGDFCEFCKISAETENTDHRSANNLGFCYERGLCGYGPNFALAVMRYSTAARWGVAEGIGNLQRLNLTVPPADLKAAEDKKNAEAIGKFIGAVAAVGLVVLAAVAAGNSQPTSSYYPQPGVDMDDNRGCCSWHGGLAHDSFNQLLCHYSGKLLCNDQQPSPTCSC